MPPPQHPRRRQPVSWYDLPTHVLSLIFEKLTGEFEDMSSCARVCFSWRSVIESLNTRRKANKPLLILADKPSCFHQETPIQKHLHLFDTRNSKSHVIRLPMFSNQFHCCYLGWLFISRSHTPHDIFVLNPLTGFEIMLPSLLARQFAKSFRVVTSSNPLDLTCVVLGAPLDPHNGHNDPDVNFCPSDPYCNKYPEDCHHHDLVFCRPHVEQIWKKIILDRDDAIWFDIILFKNQFYGMSSEYLYRISFDGHAEKLIESPFGSTRWCFHREFHVACYLVDLNGDLVVVVMTKSRRPSAGMHSSTKFEIYKLDTDCGEKVWIEITNLGGNAIYLGSASSVAVTVSAEEGDANSLFFFGDETTHQLRLENRNHTQGVHSMPHSTRPMQWFHSI